MEPWELMERRFGLDCWLAYRLWWRWMEQYWRSVYCHQHTSIALYSTSICLGNWKLLNLRVCNNGLFTSHKTHTGSLVSDWILIQYITMFCTWLPTFLLLLSCENIVMHMAWWPTKIDQWIWYSKMDLSSISALATAIWYFHDMSASSITTLGTFFLLPW